MPIEIANTTLYSVMCDSAVLLGVATQPVSYVRSIDDTRGGAYMYIRFALLEERDFSGPLD